MPRTIEVTFSRIAVLDDIWFDEAHYADLIGDGLSETEALREILRAGFEEDPFSMLEEILGGKTKLADSAQTFAASCAARIVERP